MNPDALSDLVLLLVLSLIHIWADAPDRIHYRGLADQEDH